ncbi:MAG TPA: RNA polymerase factor sigma-54, partial [Cellvibrionaceae bacterium]|nr:RNA polymerase factor sigma-54 [Cellvibrionaceae bacterium]
MKQSLQLKLGQSLTMTPQLQQAIRLLQLSTLDLQAEIQEVLDNNPMLEISEDSGPADLPDDINVDFSSEVYSHAEAAPVSQDGDAGGDSGAEGSADNFDSSTTTLNEWSDTIPTDLAVDTSWDDIYQSGP